MARLITTPAETLCARQVAIGLIASHLNLWNGRPNSENADMAEELLEDMQMFGLDEDAEHASDVCEIGLPIRIIKE